MAKYIHCITGERLPKEEIQQRLNTRPSLKLSNNVIATEEEILQKHYLSYRVIPLKEIVWAYRQVAQGEVKIGKINGRLSEQRVVVHTAPDKSFMFIFDHEDGAKKLLKFIEKKVPGCAIGATDENKARFGK